LKSTTSFFSLLLIFLLVTPFAAGEDLSIEQQEEIITNYMRATGQSSRSTTAVGDDDDHRRHKCGTPAILDFQRNYRNLDPSLLAASGVVAQAVRPTNQFTYDSPGGRIKIHYDKTGPGRVYQANIDSDNDGTPNYIESLALIADSSYAYIVDSMGYITPLPDDMCSDGGGGDDRIDIYLDSLTAGFYGLTFGDTTCAFSRPRVPSYIVMDRDFQRLPGPEYKGRPLDAARVTIAHELFHTVHFSLDRFEDSPWFEMTATWMEEIQYDEINDYYLLIDRFFETPTTSLQSISAHMYASVVWPIYLSETYGRDIIRLIWNRTAVDGDLLFKYLAATELIVDSLSGGTESFASEFARFSAWTFFTGQYAASAPGGIGFPEKANYPVIPFDQIDVQRTYPFNVTRSQKTLKPHHNSTTWVRFDGLDELLRDYWKCIRFINPGEIGPCIDSIFEENDSTFELSIGADSISSQGGGRVDWSLTVIYQLSDNLDSHVVEIYPNEQLQRSNLLEFIVGLPIVSRQYRSITIGFSPITTNPFDYQEVRFLDLGFGDLSDRSGLTQSLVNLPSSVLTPYPNPAVVSEMGGSGLNFRFQIETDETSFPVYQTAHLVVDVYTISGAYLASLVADFSGEDRNGEFRTGIYETTWNLKNQSGNEVASGAYLAYARLFRTIDRKDLLAEDRVKIAVIK